MPLLQLPAELLLLILNHVGREFFAQDPRRLAVSKQWHDLAWPVLVRDLRLTTASLVRFTADPALLARSQRHITLLSSLSHPTHHLTTLTIDTASCPLQQAPSTHLCTAINALLPTLRHMRCRTETVCEALLAGTGPLPRLKSVLVNLSLAYLADDYLSYRHARGCGGVYGRSIVRVRAAMEEAAVALVGRMGEGKGMMVRVLSHPVPALDVFAFDAVAGNRVQLWSMEKGWDAEGDPEVEEEDVQEDLAEMYESDLDS